MPQKTAQAPVLYDAIGNWLKRVTESQGEEKQGSEMETSGEGKKDPGGYMGKSDHPSARAASNLQSAPMGERAKENERDNKEDRGPASVDSTTPGSGGTQDDKQIRVGMNPRATGDDPSVEGDYKGTKDDPGTSHPCNAKEVGEKYSSWQLPELVKAAETRANEILAEIGMGFGFDDPVVSPAQRHISQQQQQQQPQRKQAASTSAAIATEQETQKAAEAGYELARMMGLSKEAADHLATEMVEALIKEAAEDAERVGTNIISHLKAKGLLKASEGEEGGGGGEAPPPSPPPPEAGMGGPEGGGGGGDAEAAAAAMAGGGGGGGGMGGPEGGGGAGQEEALQQLAMALMELGITPEQLEQMAAAQGAGGGGGMPPPGMGGGGGGMPPPGMPPPGMGGAGGGGGMPPPGMSPPGSPADMGAKIASAVRGHMRSGRFRVTAAKTAQERHERDTIKGHLMELFNL